MVWAPGWYSQQSINHPHPRTTERGGRGSWFPPKPGSSNTPQFQFLVIADVDEMVDAGLEINWVELKGQCHKKSFQTETVRV